MNYKKKYQKFFGYTDDEFIPCLVCGSTAVDIHHIVFRSQGGSDDITNLAPLCRRCHDASHNKVKGYVVTASDLQNLQLQNIIRNNLIKNKVKKLDKS